MNLPKLATRSTKRPTRQHVPALRAALLEAQVDLQENKKIPVVVLVSGQDGAGKGETINVLYEWMDPRFIIHAGLFRAAATKSASAPPCGATGARCRPRGASASLPDRGTPTRSASALTG